MNENETTKVRIRANTMRVGDRFSVINGWAEVTQVRGFCGRGRFGLTVKMPNGSLLARTMCVSTTITVERAV